jgi:8-oxo-dGTP pyrophosphatase MutT (NUDIX family)
VISWPELAAAVAAHVPRRVTEIATRAAVALVFREGPPGAGLELLFIRRAEHEGDPWSGHMGFPGGRAEPSDASDDATAARETLEETAIDLGLDAERLGALDDLRAMARGRPVDLVIAPRVYRLRRRLDGAPSHEVVSLHWLPFDLLLEPRTLSSFPYRHEGATLDLPCLRVGELVIWGLTFRMFESLVTRLGHELPSP